MIEIENLTEKEINRGKVNLLNKEEELYTGYIPYAAVFRPVRRPTRRPEEFPCDRTHSSQHQTEIFPNCRRFRSWL